MPGRADLRASRRSPGRDLIAGLTVAVVALPLALGFGAASGMGASAGLITAVVAGAVAAVFGGSNLQVSGPTGAMTVILVPIMQSHGAGGVMTVGVLAGAVLVVLAVSGVGGLVRYIPAPVVEGFTAGIAGVILLQQVPAALGVRSHGGERVPEAAWGSVTAFAAEPVVAAPALAGAVALFILLGARWRSAFPFSIVAVVLATVAAKALGLEVAGIGELPSTLPAPSLGFFRWGDVPELATAAGAVAALAALESLLSATVADGMTVGQRHDPDRELFGQGLANIAAPMFGGVPATAAIARTAVNVRSGASSRLAALFHSVVLAAVMLVAAPLVSEIPLAALAGVLIATAVRMVDVGAVSVLVRATRADAVVLVLTATATLALDLVTAVILGLVIAGALALHQVTRAAGAAPVALDTRDHAAEERALLEEHIVAYRLDGPLFFTAAHRFLMGLTEVPSVHVVILRLGRVSAIDGTGALVLRDAVERLEHRGIAVLASGVRPAHRRALDAVGLLDHLEGAGRLFATTPEAISGARRTLQGRGVLEGPPAPTIPPRDPSTRAR